eukprot:gnl/TRDRNA2_/TRDRNA2_146224_c3_seq1.p1 gnl/TRDRNA2_/TRDRNA2_146224_c3~~gnl/TRDRNA2_/TRDRNA2_146224_c3_seq1.p1  ORF type:complete len:315 (-),score=52.78 gnl/TRDRNA2_/TRDRNA2_146224_c3_seq1:106-963(-)
MAPFKAQGANQALMDAVLLSELLAESVQRYGPDIGLDIALPLFEQKMLHRSARMVVQSREKAKDVHSSLAMQPGRQVQSGTGVDMPWILEVLQEKGIGAHSAADPRGLDAMVAEVIDISDTPPGLPPQSRENTHRLPRKKMSALEAGSPAVSRESSEKLPREGLPALKVGSPSRENSEKLPREDKPAMDASSPAASRESAKKLPREDTAAVDAISAPKVSSVEQWSRTKVTFGSAWRGHTYSEVVQHADESKINWYLARESSASPAMLDFIKFLQAYVKESQHTS